LKSTEVVDFNTEVKILQKLRDVEHEHAHGHLITLLSTYTYAESHFLIFPWAETDLFGLWKRFPNVTISDEMNVWLAKQYTGLAEALRNIHRYHTFSASSILQLTDSNKPKEGERNGTCDDEPKDKVLRRIFGRHGDLKPTNILWFSRSGATDGPCQGILKIADFGSARFSKDDSWSDVEHGKAPNSPTYRSPEYELNKTCSTLCDMWALGCVYLESIAWYFRGYDFVKMCGERRLLHDEYLGMKSDTFFQIKEQDGQRTAKVKVQVTEVSCFGIICYSRALLSSTDDRQSVLAPC
jgi:serine/threonine protein kinase